MINVSTPPVVAAHYHADNSRLLGCHSAQAWIARDKSSDAFFIVALGNFHAFDTLPKLKRRLVIVDRKFPSNNVAGHIVDEERNNYFVMSFCAKRRISDQPDRLQKNQRCFASLNMTDALE
jgi:hypothetical protein